MALGQFRWALLAHRLADNQQADKASSLYPVVYGYRTSLSANTRIALAAIHDATMRTAMRCQGACASLLTNAAAAKVTSAANASPTCDAMAFVIESSCGGEFSGSAQPPANASTEASQRGTSYATTTKPAAIAASNSNASEAGFSRIADATPSEPMTRPIAKAASVESGMRGA